MIKNNEKFQLKLDQTSKQLFAEVSGSFGPDDADGFLKDYFANLKKIDPKDYKLIFDCKELKVTGKDAKSGTNMTALLKGCIEQYKKDDFKEVVFNCGSNVIIKMQLGRLSREVGILNCKVV